MRAKRYIQMPDKATFTLEKLCKTVCCDYGLLHEQVLMERNVRFEFVLRLRDDDGEWVTAGDTVHFSYGIPPVGVDAPIIERNGKLIGLCPGHKPSEFNLRSLRRYVGSWYKQNDMLTVSGGQTTGERHGRD